MRDIENGYNFNIDLKYEYFANNNRDMFSAGIYYKFLKDPIERDTAVFRRFRSLLVQKRRAGYGPQGSKPNSRRVSPKTSMPEPMSRSLYTDVKLLSNGGVYTDDRRALQGASPYLGNAFLTYAPPVQERFFAFALAAL